MTQNCQTCTMNQTLSGTFTVVNGDLWQNVTGSLPPEGKKIYEQAYQDYKDKDLSDAEAAQRAWGAVKQAGWYQDKEGNWVKKETKQNRQDLEGLAVALLFMEQS